MTMLLFPLLLLLFAFSCYRISQRGQKTAKRKPRDAAQPIDHRIPPMPLFTLLYVGGYAYWFLALHHLSFHEEAFARASIALCMGAVLCTIVYLVAPTQLRRPELPASDKLPFRLLKSIYESDEPACVCPSLHCMLTWVCFLGLWQLFYGALLPMILLITLAFLLCISTLLIKQQCFLGMAMGVGIAQAVYLIAGNAQLLDAAVTMWSTLARMLR